MAVGLALVAPDAVPLIFGQAWTGAIVPLQILALYGCARSVSALVGPLLTSLQDTRYVMRTNVAAAFLMPAAFYIGSRWGTGGIAASWIGAYPVILFLLFRRVLGKVGINVSTYLNALWPAISGVAIMTVIVEMLRLIVLRYSVPWVRLIGEISVGVAGYAFALLLLHRKRVVTIAEGVRRVRAHRPAAAKSAAAESFDRSRF